jgi:hypothetical protein
VNFYSQLQDSVVRFQQDGGAAITFTAALFYQYAAFACGGFGEGVCQQFAASDPEGVKQTV